MIKTRRQEERWILVLSTGTYSIKFLPVNAMLLGLSAKETFIRSSLFSPHGLWIKREDCLVIRNLAFTSENKNAGGSAICVEGKLSMFNCAVSEVNYNNYLVNCFFSNNKLLYSGKTREGF